MGGYNPSGLMNSIMRYPRALVKYGTELGHPFHEAGDWAKEMLGMPPMSPEGQEAQQLTQQNNDAAVQRANASFAAQAQAAKPNPVLVRRAVRK